MWCQQTNRAVFTWKQLCHEAGKGTYQDRHSTFNISMRGAIQRGAAENEVHKHEEKLTGASRQMSTLRRRYEKRCKGDDVEGTAHPSNNKRHSFKAWSRSCSRTLGLMTENS